jgi:hypothetical protein
MLAPPPELLLAGALLGAVACETTLAIEDGRLTGAADAAAGVGAKKQRTH